MSESDLSPGSWNTWSARPELMPRCMVEGPCWTVEAGGSASNHGGWDLHWHHIRPGEWHRANIACRAYGLAHVHDTVHAELIWWKDQEKRSDWCHVEFEPIADDVYEFRCESRAPKDAQFATLRLMLRWSDHGKIAWCDPILEPIAAPAPRKFTAAIATGNFPGTGVEDNLAFAQTLVTQAASAGAQVVCLPECVTSWRCNDLPNAGARVIPGPETDRLCDVAASGGIDVVCSMNEQNGDLIHNTGLYIDSEQGIIGKYRKVHLSVGERWRGITPGSEFPVWHSRFGTAGMLICYDNVMGEGHNILARQGAEILYLPIMGDPRAIGDPAHENWKRIMQVRAMDNHVWFVVCQNKGEWGLIVRPDGKIVAEVDLKTGIALAEVDLNFRFSSTIGSDFQNRVWGERRPHLYRMLSEDYL